MSTLDDLDLQITETLTGCERLLSGVMIRSQIVSRYLERQIVLAEEKQLELMTILHGIKGVINNCDQP